MDDNLLAKQSVLRATVDAKTFSAALKKVRVVTLRKSIVPVLSEVCVRFAGGRCILTGTNLTAWITAEIPAGGDDFSFVFSKSKDVERACRYFDGDITLELSMVSDPDSSIGIVTLSCGLRSGEFETYPVEDYPEAPELKGTVLFRANAACPCCHQPTRIHESKSIVNGVEKITRRLFCDNEDCTTRRLRQFVHFASKKAMNIEGLSEGKLEKLIGWSLLRDRLDIYGLDAHRNVIVMLEGFGEKSWQNLWDAIQRSRDTTFERYLIAMDIPQIGNTASRTLARQFHSSLDEFEAAVCNGFDFTQLPDFGETLHQNIYQWFQNEENWYLWSELRNHVRIAPPPAEPEPATLDNPFVGKTVVVTGKVEPYNRDGINAKIISLGAHAGSSVSGKTDYLVCGENAGSKLEKARSLGVTVLTPAQFFQMAGA